MSCIDTLKISNKNAIKKAIDYKNRQKKGKNKIIFNTIIDVDKLKNKKISKSKSSSIIIGKRKTSEKKRRHILIPNNLGAPLIKTYNTKKKIEYNKSASDIINNNPLKGLSNKNFNNYDHESFYKNRKNSRHSTINYIINNFNLSLKKKNSNGINKNKEFKGINKSLINNSNYSKYEELKKENENLTFIFAEKLKENKRHKDKINYLENKNCNLIKTYNTKKKIEYNKSASDIINNNPLRGFSNKNCNNYDYDSFHKNKKNSQHNTINYIINNINLSLKKKEFNGNNKNREFKGINR